MLEACSVNSVATSEKYFRILIQRLGLGMQPLCAWMAWIRAISLAISLSGDRQTTRLQSWQDFNYRPLVSSCKESPQYSGRVSYFIYLQGQILVTEFLEIVELKQENT